MFRVLTVAREYGSGGGLIARKIAEKLGWDLLDKGLVERIARLAQVDPGLAQEYDERVDSWVHRASRRGLWHGAFEGVATVTGLEVFDAEAMAALGRDLIIDSHSRGNCVIVGRGAQCVLQDRKDVLHVFIYAPWRERIARVRGRLTAAADVEHLIRLTDQQRAGFIRLYFGCNWNDPHLYHMLISSEFGEDDVARMIIDAIQRGDEPCARGEAQEDDPKQISCFQRTGRDTRGDRAEVVEILEAKRPSEN
jgi:cytidylate kinase